MTPSDRTGIEKAAVDNGFELSPERQEDGLTLPSPGPPEIAEDPPIQIACFTVRASEPILLECLPLAREGWTLTDGTLGTVDATLERAAAMARTMPSRNTVQIHIRGKG